MEARLPVMLMSMRCVPAVDGGRRELRHVHRPKFFAADVQVC